jgi:penicillin-binding protein 2
MEGDGTSAHIFSGFGNGQYTVYGKTGTVERPGQADQSWYVAYVPHPKRPIVVAVTVEKGGFGSDTAAPAACRILAKHFELSGDGECTPAKASTPQVIE